MTDRSKQDRDQRALDALIVSQLRLREQCDNVDIDHLPKLTKEEHEVLASLDSEFINRLLSGGSTSIIDEPTIEVNEELLCAGGMSYGLNRAEEIDERTAAEIELKRNEIIERLERGEGRHE